MKREHRKIKQRAHRPQLLTALEAMSDLYKTLPEEAAATWESDSRATELKDERLPNGVRDPYLF
jgi:hypothetical protein